MENFKIENFKKHNITEKFPLFDPLTPKHMKEIRKIFLERMGIICSKISLAEIINERGKISKDFNANCVDFLLESIFSRMGIRPNEKVYINWYRFDDIDEMHFIDLNKYFDDIWYPGSDDIDIFDATFSWVLSISHDGNVKFLSIGG